MPVASLLFIANNSLLFAGIVKNKHTYKNIPHKLTTLNTHHTMIIIRSCRRHMTSAISLEIECPKGNSSACLNNAHLALWSAHAEEGVGALELLAGVGLHGDALLADGVAVLLYVVAGVEPREGEVAVGAALELTRVDVDGLALSHGCITLFSRSCVIANNIAQIQINQSRNEEHIPFSFATAAKIPMTRAAWRHRSTRSVLLFMVASFSCFLLEAQALVFYW